MIDFQQWFWKKKVPLIGLIGIALLQVLLYWWGITAHYPLAQGLLQPRAVWLSLVQFSRTAALQHATLYTLLMLSYVVALRLALRVQAAQQRSAVLAILGGWLLCSIALLGAYPGDSLDIFEYIFRGRMQALFGASPLVVPPAAFRDQPFYNYLTWSDWVDAYGPLWEYASWMVASTVGAVSDGRLEDYVLGYRVFAIAVTGLSGVLIALIVRRQSPQHLAAALVGWFWNPLLLFATAVGAHNDAIMLVLLLTAVLLLQRERWLLGVLALGLAAHVKITALLLAPLLGLWLLRQRGWRQTFGTVVVALAFTVPLSWLLYAPYGGWATLPRMLRERHIYTYTSLADSVYHVLHYWRGWDQTEARQAVMQGAEVCFLVFAVPLLLLFWRRINGTGSDAATLWQTSANVTLLYLVVGCFWFQYWYVLWVLVFAALLPASRLTSVLLPCLALGALWSNLLSNFLLQGRVPLDKWLFINRLMLAVVLVPPLLARLVIMAIHVRGRGRRIAHVKRWLAR